MIPRARLRPSGAVPGAPTGLAPAGVTPTSITVTWSPPVSGGTLNFGSYTLQEGAHSGALSTIATVQYCTVGTGTTPNALTDSFGNIWAIGTTGPTGVYLNNAYISPTNGVTLMYLVAGVVWQFGSGSWYSFQPVQLYGVSPSITFSGPFASSPLVITVTSLTAITTYDFKVNVSNSSGPGPYTAIVPIQTTALPTITAITLSGTSFSSNTAPPVTVGAIGVTMSSGSFGGTVSENSANFAVSSATLPSNLVTSVSLAAGTYSDTITATWAGGAANSPFSQTFSNLVAANVPGTVTSLASPSNTSTSVTLSWAAPATGGALDYGAYQVQYQNQTDGGSFVTYPTAAQYCTLGTGTSPNSATDGFNNVWGIGPVGPNGVYVNNTPVSPTNNVTQVLVIGNTVYQFGSGSWYSLTATQNYGTTVTPVFNPAPAPPLSAFVISPLSASKLYNFQVRVSNSSGFGPYTASLPVTTGSVVTAKIIWGSNPTFHNAPDVVTQNNLIASTGNTIRTLLAYYESGWGGYFDQDIFTGAAGQVITPANGGFPMVALRAIKPDLAQTCNDILDGAHDGYINTIFQSFKNAGYTQMCMRILWEANYFAMPSNYSQAWQRVANLCFAAKANIGIQVYTAFNPGSGSNGLAYYPSGGDGFVDWITIDQSANWNGQGRYYDVMDTNQANCHIGGVAQFAVLKGKPFAICEGGAANISNNTNGESFVTNLNGNISNSSTSINLTSNFAPGAGIPPTPFPIQIDSEWINIGSVSGATLNVAANGRGFNGTIAASHNSGTQVVYGGYSAFLCNILTVVKQVGAKLVLYAFYNGNADDGFTNENWNVNASDTTAFINFINNCPVWQGNLSSTGH